MKINNFINGEFQAPLGGRYLDNFEPARGLVYSQVASSEARDVSAAVSAAVAVQKAWSKTSAESRAQILFKVADLIDANLDELASLESRDQGKPVWLAKSMDIPRAALNFRFFARELLQTKQTMTQTDSSVLNLTLRKPLGVVGLISPWNLPLYLLTWKLAPALATGNVCICKPSELTSMTAFRLCQLFNEAGLPAGVVNMVFGLGADVGEALVAHPQVKAISFTGGTVTGRRIMSQAAVQTKKLSLELGGKNANVIFADCDLEKAVDTTIRSSFLNQGEICLCGSRILVEQNIYEEFLRRFKSKAQELKVGDPGRAENFLGALVSHGHLQKVKSYLDIAEVEGVRIVLDGRDVQVMGDYKNGYFLGPTILADVPAESRIFKEEIFGPVVSVTAFKSEDEAIRLANNVEYGLSASVWTSQLDRAHRLARELEVGTCWINTWMLRDLRMSFGGMKSSGLGREGGDHSFEFFTETTTVCYQFEEAKDGISPQ